MRLKIVVNCHVTIVFMVLLASAPADLSAQDGVIDSVYCRFGEVQPLKEVVIYAPVGSKVKANSIETRIVGSNLEHIGSAEDVLARVPGMIKNGETLEVIGRGAPVFYVNGRRIYDLGELKQIHSEQIRAIEVINNPGVDYDATISAVVKIKTRRVRGEGLGLDAKMKLEQSLYRNQTSPGMNVAMNYRHKNIDIFGGANNWIGHYNEGGGIAVKTNSHGIRSEQIGNYNIHGRSACYQINLGSAWQLNDSNTVGGMVRLDGCWSNKSEKTVSETVWMNGAQTDGLTTLDKWRSRPDRGYLVNAYYSGKIGDVSIDWNLDRYHHITSQNNDIMEKSYMESRLFPACTYTKNNMWATSLVVSYPYRKSRFKLGSEYVSVNNDNTYEAQSLSMASESNTHEKIAAFFSEYSLMSPIGQWIAGLRCEHIIRDYADILVPANNNRAKQNELYPFFSWSKSFGLLNLSLNYTVKTIRPQYWQLIDAMKYHSRFIYERGNPQLDNTVDYTLSLSANYKWLVYGFDYIDAKHAIMEWATPYYNDGTILLQSENLPEPTQSITTYIVAQPRFGCWMPHYTIGFSKQFLTLDLYDDCGPSGVRSSSFSRPMFVVMANNTFKIDTRRHNPWQSELNLQYQSKMSYKNSLLQQPSWILNVAIQRTYMNGNLTFRLSGNNLLDRIVSDALADYGNCFVRKEFNHHQSNISLDIHYRLNASRTKYRGGNAGQDAINRM